MSVAKKAGPAHHPPPLPFISSSWSVSRAVLIGMALVPWKHLQWERDVTTTQMHIGTVSYMYISFFMSSPHSLTSVVNHLSLREEVWLVQGHTACTQQFYRKPYNRPLTVWTIVNTLVLQYRTVSDTNLLAHQCCSFHHSTWIPVWIIVLPNPVPPYQ